MEHDISKRGLGMTTLRHIQGTAFPLIISLNLALASVPAAAQQQKPSVLEKLQAAESFAAKLARPGSPEFDAYRRKALDIAITPLSPSRSTRMAAPPLPTGRTAPSVENDPRFQENTVTMVRQTTSGVQPRIFGGTLVVASAFPDAVSVEGNGGLCSGTLIAPSVVLTAKHCHCGQVNARVKFGVDLQRPDKTIGVSKSVAMGTCGLGLDKGQDVALLFLENPSTVTPRTLAAAKMIASIVDVTAVGFGLTEKGTSGLKLTVDLPVASTSCDGTFDGRQDAAYYGCVKSQELVAGVHNLNKDTCHGDSGGPIYAKIGNQEVLVGATSRGVQTPGASDCGDGGVYELVQGRILDWIQNTNHVAVKVAP